jgi:hypothetical protein
MESFESMARQWGGEKTKERKKERKIEGKNGGKNGGRKKGKKKRKEKEKIMKYEIWIELAWRKWLVFLLKVIIRSRKKEMLHK